MDAAALASALVTSIDAHDWTALAGLLHEDFRCELVHTGEVFEKDHWVALNRDYPGFERMILRDLVAVPGRAVLRAQVTGRDGEGALQQFEVASFLTLRDNLIGELTEVWADVGVAPPPGTRLP